MVPSIEVKGNSPMTHDRFDFHVIDSVYGKNSDLYYDVFGIHHKATRKEIRAAFVDSRDEFFQFQSQVENGNVVVTEGQMEFSKRRMDAVVAAFRILHDPDLRTFYDEGRDQRLHRRKSKPGDSKDPVDQAVHRALEKKGRASTRRPSSRTGMSPLQSSFGASTPDSADCERRNTHSPTKKRTSRNKSSTPDSSSRRITSTPDLSDSEMEGPRSPAKKRTSRRKTPPSSPFAENPVGCDDERRNSHSPTIKRTSPRGRSSKRIESPSFVMKVQTPSRRKEQVYASPPRSLFDADLDSVSIHSHDIGASRNYHKERKSPGLDTVSTVATIDEDVLPKYDSYVNLEDGSNSLMATASIEPTEDEPTEQTDDVSVQESTAPSVMSYMYDDETTVGEEQDLSELCCFSDERRISTRDRGFVARTRIFIRAIKSEISGSINDTVTAVDQVCNAFTLQEKDIQAVTSRIDKASKQLKG
jgi:curved DNA-binding protein CbpA